jgi:TonB family protein
VSVRANALIFAVLFTAPFADAATNTTEIIGSFIPAKPIDRPRAGYPNDARFKFSGGWVKIAFCVDAHGAVSNAVVASSSRAGDFEQSVFDSLRNWKYEPARFEDKAIEQCGLYADFLFQMPGRLGAGARTGFAKNWRKANTLLQKGQADDAAALVAAQTPWNNYEEVRLILLRARVARARGDAGTELIELNNAISWSQNLEPDVYAEVLHRALALNVQSNQIAAALMNYHTLSKIQPGSITEEERRSVAHFVGLVNGEANLATPVKIEIAERSGTDGLGVWSTALLRRSKVGFDAPSGTFRRVEVRCAERWYVGRVAVDQPLQLAPDTHQCSAFVFGEPGSTVSLVEYPVDRAQPTDAHLPVED